MRRKHRRKHRKYRRKGKTKHRRFRNLSVWDYCGLLSINNQDQGVDAKEDGVGEAEKKWDEARNECKVLDRVKGVEALQEALAEARRACDEARARAERLEYDLREARLPREEITFRVLWELWKLPLFLVGIGLLLLPCWAVWGWDRAAEFAREQWRKTGESSIFLYHRFLTWQKVEGVLWLTSFGAIVGSLTFVLASMAYYKAQVWDEESRVEEISVPDPVVGDKLVGYWLRATRRDWK